jgi:hypothetical protein
LLRNDAHSAVGDSVGAIDSVGTIDSVGSTGPDFSRFRRSRFALAAAASAARTAGRLRRLCWRFNASQLRTS